MTSTATRSEEGTGRAAESTSRTTRGKGTGAASGAAGAVVGAATAAGDAARTFAADAATRLPDVMASSIATFDRANANIRAASDEMLTLGTAVSFGFAAGLLIGGGNRVLVGAALLPVAMMGLTLLDRASARRRSAGGMGTAGL